MIQNLVDRHHNCHIYFDTTSYGCRFAPSLDFPNSSKIRYAPISLGLFPSYRYMVLSPWEEIQWEIQLKKLTFGSSHSLRHNSWPAPASCNSPVLMSQQT